MHSSKQSLLDDIRRDVRATRLRALRRDVCKTLAFWAASLTLFCFSTKENKYLSPTANLPVHLAVVLVLLLIPLLYLKMWEYPRCLRGVRGRVIQKRMRSERVTRTDRNVGYTNRAGDMIPVNVMDVIIRTAAGKQDLVKMMGNHLFGLGQQYYSEGDEVERFVGAGYFYNHTATRKPYRSFCLYCGYLGAVDEKKCSRCACTLLMPDALTGETE